MWYGLDLIRGHIRGHPARERYEETYMKNSRDEALETARSNGQIAIWDVISASAVVLTPDRRDVSVACPTCKDGIRTVRNPRRCRECTKAGW